MRTCPEPVWRAHCPDDSRTAGLVAHHAATACRPLSLAIRHLASGGTPPPMTWATLDEINAVHSVQHADCTPAEVIDLLAETVPAAAAIIEGLTDEDLDGVVPMAWSEGSWPLEMMVRLALVGHFRRHTESVRAAVAVGIA